MKNPFQQFAKGLLTFSFLTLFFLNANAECTYLKQLEATQKEKDNLLTWSTLTETGTAFFLIERSLNGINFEEAARVEGNGTTTEKNQYSFTDIGNMGLRVFYRLAEVNMEGEVEFTNTVLINRKGEDIVFEIKSIESGVTDKYFNMSLESTVTAPMEYRLQTRMGEKLLSGVMEVVEGQNALSIDLHDAEVGTYQFSIRIKNEIEVIALQKVDEAIKPKSIMARKEEKE
ncbi:MAG: hypothetical protein AB8F74_11460 [Saprospiraceae bacterium]